MTDLKEVKELLKSMIPGKPVPDDVWETRDGRRVHIVEMTDKHLVNTLLYLKRRYKAMLQPMLRDNWRTFLPGKLRAKFYNLEAEANKRGFTDWESRLPIRE